MDLKFLSSPDAYNLLGALIVSVVSGLVSISRRVLQGYSPSILWVISEFMTAILCGYLMFTAYPFIQETVPKWFTLPIAVALAAHVGGKVFQEVETRIITEYAKRFKAGK